MFVKMAIWYLRKTKKSVLIGYRIENGSVKALNDGAFLYDNELHDIDYRCSDDSPFDIPEGKFHVVSKKIK